MKMGNNRRSSPPVVTRYRFLLLPPLLLVLFLPLLSQKSLGQKLSKPTALKAKLVHEQKIVEWLLSDSLIKSNSMIMGENMRFVRLFCKNLARSLGPGPTTFAFAIVSVDFKEDERAYGIEGAMNLWNPAVERDDEFSLAQMRVVAGPPDDLNTIEAGWQVYPGEYGDRQTRFFVYWTADGYRRTGCYNLDCQGFKQVQRSFPVGAPLRASEIDGEQTELALRIWRNSTTKDWRVGVALGRELGGTVLAIGYWPAQLITNLRDGATRLEWGGEVVNVEANGLHTKTEMGSGRFEPEGWGKAAYFRRLGYVDASGKTLPAPYRAMTTKVTDPDCYNIRLEMDIYDEAYGTYFFYGGPGNNPKCP